MRSGLDDALDKLARRDELRRRATGEATGTTGAVTELVEAIAAVVARHPNLGVTVGAEGAGDPVLLHFQFAEGQVQVTADKPVPPNEHTPVSRHVDIDIDLDETIDEPHSPPPPPPVDPRRLSRDDQDRYGPATYGYAEPIPARGDTYSAGSDTAQGRHGSFDTSPESHHATRDLGDSPGHFGERLRDPGAARSVGRTYAPHPYAATPPPSVPDSAQATRRINVAHHARAVTQADPVAGGAPRGDRDGGPPAGGPAARRPVAAPPTRA